MKKFIYTWLWGLMVIALLPACTEEEGTEPGGDGQPVVTLYAYDPGKGYNPENDVRVRFSTNIPTEEVYYLVEKATEKESFLSANGMDAYAERVVSNGKKVESAAGEADVDVVITGIKGQNAITAVAVGRGQKAMAEVNFFGYAWIPMYKGVYTSEFFEQSWEAILEYEADAKLYRFANCWAKDYHVLFAWNDAEVLVNSGDKFTTGVNDSNYGPVSATQVAAGYDEASKTLSFTYEWTVSAGSFGEFSEYFVIQEQLQ